MNYTNTKHLTILIPLYKSKRFLDIICQNIDEHLDIGACVLVSDKHCFDDTTSFIKKKYEDERNIKVFESEDNGDWIDNINFLISETQTKFGRIIPHDDTASGKSSAILVNSLLDNPEAIMASGIVKAYDINENPLPNKDELNTKEDRFNKDWTFEDKMQFFWTGRFSGSFKGVWNNYTIKKHNLYIKKTPTLIHSERLWLCALSMIGRFHFEPNSVLKKRYYESSTHAKWKTVPSTFLDSGKILFEYFSDLNTDGELLDKAKFIIYHNSIQKARFFENRIGNTIYKNVSPVQLM